MTYNEATKVLEDIRLKKEVGACITAGMKRDRDATDKMKKTKLIPMTEEEYRTLNSEQKKCLSDIQKKGKKFNVHFLDGAKAEQAVSNLIVLSNDILFLSSPAKERIKELQIRLAEALEVDEAHQKQMGKLQVRLTEVEEDNQKLAHQVEDLKLNGVRKAGL